MEWRMVVGWPEYEVSSVGSVRRVASGRGSTVGRILKATADKYGYPTVELQRPGVRKRVNVHILTAAAFIRPIRKGEEVNHKNGDKADGRADNLEIGTRQHNVDHAWAAGLTDNRGEKCNFARLTREQADEIRSSVKSGKLTYRGAAEKFRVSQTTVWRIVAGRTWS